MRRNVLFPWAVDNQPPRLGMGGLRDDFLEEGLPRGAMMGARVDEDPVHVKDDGLSHMT